MEQRLLGIQQILLRELYPEPALRQLLRDNVRQDITGCLHPQVKPAGAWLMEEHTLEADTAAMHPMVTLITLLLQAIQEDIIAEASLGTLSVKSVLTGHVLEATHGTDQNVHHSPPQVIPEATTTTIIILVLILILAILIPAPLTITVPAPLLLLVHIHPEDAAMVGLIGVLVPAKVLVAMVEKALHILALAPAVPLHPADAATAGLTIVHVLAKQPHRKDATMYRHPVAGPDFIGMLLPVPAVPAIHLQLLPVLQLQLRPAQQAHVRQDTIGCLIMADGACLTAQQAAADPQQHLRLLLQLLQQLRQLNQPLRQQLRRQQPKPVLLLPQQANPHRLPPVLNVE